MLLPKKSHVLLVSSLLAANFSHSVTAQPTELTHMMVTATRIATPLNMIAGSATLITRQDIEKNQFQTLADALKTVPGLTVVESGARGSQTSVFARGTNSNHTLVLVDGIEINDPSSPTSAFDFSNFLIDDIESIDIVRGSQSVLYGADAIGAVIQIHTRRGQGQLKTTAKLAAGNKSTSYETLTISGESGPINYSVNGGLFESQGDSITPNHAISSDPRDDDGYRNKLFSTRLGFMIGQQIETNLFLRHIETETEIDGFLAEDADAYNSSRQTYSGIEFKGQFLDGLWQPTLLLSHTAIQRDNHNTRLTSLEDADQSRYLGEKTKLSLQNNVYLNDYHTVTAGYEYEKERLDAKGQTIFGSPFGDFIINQQSDASRRNRAVYVQDQITINSKLSGTLGLRYDHPDDFSSETTYKLAANYLLNDQSRIWLSFGTGYRAPSLYELFGFSPTNFGTAYNGNPVLDAESSKTWELGLHNSWLDERLQADINLYKTRIDDLITTVFLPSFNSTSINQNEAKIHGLESTVSMSLTDALAVKLNYSFTRSKDDDDKELLRRPKHQIITSLEYHYDPKLSFNTNLRYTGSRKDVDALGQRVLTSGYSVVDLSANYLYSPQLRFFSRIDNLLNKDYEPVYGYQAAGTTVLIGIEVSSD